MLSWVEIMIMTWQLNNISFLYFKELLSCFCSMFWALIFLNCEALSYQFCNIWLNLSSIKAICMSEFILLLLSAVTSSVNTRDLAPMTANAVMLPPQCLTDDVYAPDHELFLFFSTLCLAIILVQAKLGFICPKHFVM